MIYEWGRTITHICRCIRHYFRKMFCKDYFVDSHGLAECRVTHYWCGYLWCPKWKGADDYERASEQREHDILYEPTYNEDDGSM